MKRVRVIVRGRVQNVWYRASTEDMARERDLAGWVRNLPDGTVEAVFEGLDADVDAAVSWCRQGPPLARVEAVEVAAEEPEGLTGFGTR